MGGGTSPTGGGGNQRNAPLTGGGNNVFGGLGRNVGLRPMGTTPMMPSQQNFQQNQAAMPSAQPTQGMAGGGIYQPQPGNAANTGVLIKGQGDFTPQQLARSAALSGGITWNGAQPDYAGGRNNWLAGPSAWRGDNPGAVSPEQLAAIQRQVGGLRGLMRQDQQMINQGQRRAEGMDLLQQRMQNLRAYQRFMRAHAATPAAAGTTPAVDPNAVGVASDAMGGLTNSAQLLAMLAAQQGA